MVERRKTRMTEIKTISDLEALRGEFQNYRNNFKSSLVLCGGTGCRASRSHILIDAVKDELAKQGLEKDVLVRATGCHGFCEQGPIVVVEPGNIFYCHVSPDDAQEIISKTVNNQLSLIR